jgi:hypothetical protein
LNIGVFFYLIVSLIYLFVTPLFFYYSGRKTVWGDLFGSSIGVDISDYYDNTLLYYGIALFFFLAGYFYWRSKKIQITASKKLFNPQKKIILVFIFSFSLVFIDFLMAGINPIDVLLGESERNMFVLVATTNYLRNFADTIVACLVIAFYYQVQKKYFVFMTLMSFILFSLLGFRYRIILSIMGFFFVYLFKRKVKVAMILKSFFIASLFIIFILFITVNRFALFTGNYRLLTIDPKDYPVEIVFEQTRGMLADINVIKYMEVINPDAPYDYGITFLYFIVRALPRSIVGEDFKDSLYPPPAHAMVQESYQLPRKWTKTIGEASLHYSYFFIAGGPLALFILSFFFGSVYKWFKNKYPPVTDKFVLLNIFLCLVTFQWISRGYFPQTVDHLVFFLIGYWLFYYLAEHEFKIK